MAQKFLFYDLETTGLNPAFDQVLQFAGVLTDASFNTLSEHEVRIRLRPDIVPAPEAVLTHLISPKMMQNGVCEAEGIATIHALLNTPNTTSLGYNTLSFDDEFLRFSFYRNLLPPYTHQFSEGCRRMDIFPLTILFYLYGNVDITWPERDARVSLKLEHLNDANGLAVGQAHDAMVDVRAAIALAKKLKQSEKMWSYACDYFDKNIEMMRLRQLPYAFQDTVHQEGVLIHSQLGYKNHFQSFAVCLGQHRHYQNQWCWLRLDLPELSQATPSAFTDHTWVIRKKRAEPPFILPPHPRFLRYFTPEKSEIIAHNKAYLAAHPALLKSISDYYLDYQYPLVPEADIDSTLYQTGFMSRKDQHTAQQFHEAPIAEKSHYIEQFTDTDLQTLAIRLLGRNYPGSLEDVYLQQYETYRQAAFSGVDYKQQAKLTPTLALTRLDALSDGDPTLKAALRLFYTRLSNE